MAKYNCVRRVFAVLLTLAMFFMPVTALAGDGKKRFKEGIKQSANQQWVKAAEQFALAVADEPSNVEYQLHFHRSLVNAALMMIERGDKFAEQLDYKAAYTAYRQAYGFDPSNELALIKMHRMLEAQGLPVQSSPQARHASVSTNTVKAADTTSDPVIINRQNEPQRRLAIMDVILRNSNLLLSIEQLAQRLGLNVAFDQQVETSMKSRPISVELRDVGAAEALEIILRMSNLSYVQIGKRTLMIIVDGPQNRTRYEQMELRTFWIKNADVNELRTAVMSMAGTKQVVISKQLNALTVRDTPANLEMIESIIDSFDKSKAEVLIDVKLYEVSRNALLQLGNQFRSTGDDNNPLALRSLGGVDQQLNVLGQAARTLKGPLGFALGLPASSISFFEDRGKAKLLASTQVHVLDNEQHQIRIGQRVPIKTGSSTVLGSGSQPGTNPTNPSVGFNTVDNIQYENVGLNIDMQPQVFDEEVQMKMKIESSSVDRSTGDLTPSFNQRTMSSVARIKNGQTTLIAGVSQSEESKQVQGIPLIGLIPVLGRFFSTPATSNRQSDVVITVTPHILRQANIRDRDHLARDAGRGADPARQLTIEQILHRAERAESRQNQIAMASEANRGRAPESTRRVDVTLSPESGIVTTNAFTSAQAQYSDMPRATPRVEQEVVENPGADASEKGNGVDEGSDRVKVIVRPATAVAIKDQDYYVAVTLIGNAKIASADISLGYDADIFEVKEVRDGGLLGAGSSVRFDNPQGLLRMKINRAANSREMRARGLLLFIVFKVKKQGRSALSLNEHETRLIMPGGQSAALELHSSQAEAR